MQWMSKFTKKFRFLLCIIDNYSKYAWVISLKDRTGITVTNAFRKILDELNCKSNKRWVDKGSESYNRSINFFWKIMIKKYIQHIIKENPLLLKDTLEP